MHDPYNYQGSDYMNLAARSAYSRAAIEPRSVITYKPNDMSNSVLSWTRLEYSSSAE